MTHYNMTYVYTYVYVYGTFELQLDICIYSCTVIMQGITHAATCVYIILCLHNIILSLSLSLEQGKMEDG